MKSIGRVLPVILLVLALGILPVAAQGVTFTFGEFGNPVQLDAAVVTDGISFRTLSQGCETLVEFQGDTTIPGPALSTSWTNSEDGLTWTFQLVENATFHDGTPFNAEAVKWNFDRWRLTSHPQHFPEQVFEYYEAQFNGFDENSLITDVQATGEFEVTFTLSAPIGAFLNNMAMPMFSIASPAAVIENGTAYGTPEIGYSCTGPFVFQEWVSDDRVVLTRNANYWGEIPGNVDTVVFRIIPDNAARLAALQSGDIDAFERPNVEDVPGIEAADDLYIQLRPAFNVFYLAFNYRIAEFRDPRVRQAFSLAINRQEIVDAFYVPGSIAANTMNPPSIGIGFNPDVSTPYNPELARQLLADAGFPNGLSELNVLALDADGNITETVEQTIPVQLFFMPVARPYNPDGEGIGNAMVSYLADVGITAELASAGDWSAYLGARANGELLGLYQLGWTGDNGDPDNFIGYFFASVDRPLPREGFYQNAEVAQLLQEGRTSTDQAARDQIYRDAEAIMATESARIYIAHGPVPLAFNNRVSGYITNPVGTELFKYVTISS
jgi:peptide/nickel transport system substrate-binding protein